MEETRIFLFPEKQKKLFSFLAFWMYVSDKNYFFR